MYHPTTRVLAVLELLQTHGRMSGPALAERLEVDLRTIRRYVTMLQDLGIPVTAERGRDGGYRLLPGHRLPPLLLTDAEALAVTLGLLAARRSGIATAPAAVEGALAKVERSLPPDVRERVAAVQGALSFAPNPRPARPTGAAVLALGEAAFAARRARIRYASAQGAETERVIAPYGLAHVAGRWYAAAWCCLRDDLRVFRLDRVRSVEPLAETFVRPPGFDALAFVQQALAGAPGVWRVEALLGIELAAARGIVAPHEAELTATEGGTLLRLSAECLDWAARYLVGLGCPFVVRQPPELGEALRALARRIVAGAEMGAAATDDRAALIQQ